MILQEAIRGAHPPATRPNKVDQQGPATIASTRFVRWPGPPRPTTMSRAADDAARRSSREPAFGVAKKGKGQRKQQEHGPGNTIVPNGSTCFRGLRLTRPQPPGRCRRRTKCATKPCARLVQRDGQDDRARPRSRGGGRAPWASRLVHCTLAALYRAGSGHVVGPCSARLHGRSAPTKPSPNGSLGPAGSPTGSICRPRLRREGPDLPRLGPLTGRLAVDDAAVRVMFFGVTSIMLKRMADRRIVEDPPSLQASDRSPCSSFTASTLFLEPRGLRCRKAGPRK